MRRYFNIELKSKYLNNVTYYIEADNTVRKTFMFHNGNKSVNFIRNTNYVSALLSVLTDIEDVTERCKLI